MCGLSKVFQSGCVKSNCLYRYHSLCGYAMVPPDIIAFLYSSCYACQPYMSVAVPVRPRPLPSLRAECLPSISNAPRKRRYLIHRRSTTTTSVLVHRVITGSPQCVTQNGLRTQKVYGTRNEVKTRSYSNLFRHKHVLLFCI